MTESAFGFQDIKRMEGEELEAFCRYVAGYAKESSICEACNLSLNQHLWIDIDKDGIAVACSNQKETASDSTVPNEEGRTSG